MSGAASDARRTEPLSVRRAGDRALLVECEGNDTALAVTQAARERWQDELQDVVPGHRTVLLQWWAGVPDMGSVVSSLKQFVVRTNCSRDDTDAPIAPEVHAVTIPVIYDGADLDAVAQRLGVSRERVVELHSAPEYRVAFVGFLPGFPYLIGGHPLLQLPRLGKPRTRVAAGSVAIAAGYCGIYPRASPGGWNLLGRTDAVMFDAGRDPPALLSAGMRVRFRPLPGEL